VLCDCLQEQFYQLWEQNPASSAYNSGFYLCLEGQLDVNLLRAAAALLVERQQVGGHWVWHQRCQMLTSTC
jgi:hypothetical protein